MIRAEQKLRLFFCRNQKNRKKGLTVNKFNDILISPDRFIDKLNCTFFLFV